MEKREKLCNHTIISKIKGKIICYNIFLNKLVIIYSCLHDLCCVVNVVVFHLEAGCIFHSFLPGVK